MRHREKGRYISLAVKERVFNNRKRKVFRKRIPAREMAWSLALLLVLGIAGFWFISQKNTFDPSERDISTSVLAASSVEDKLYQTPLQRWLDPAKAAASGGNAAAPDLGLFPPAILDGGWAPSSRLQEFDPDTLFEKIDGAAEQYIQFGLQKLHYVALAKADSGQEMGIELYDMGQFQNALGIFSAQKDGAQKTEKSGPADFYRTEAGAVAIFGRYYLKLAGNANEISLQEKAVQLVGALSVLASGAEDTPKPYLMFSEGLGLTLDAIAYERTDVFQYSFAKDFWFGTPKDAPGTRFYIHEAASEVESDTLFNQLLENHRYDYAVIEEGEQDVVLKHNFLNTFLTLSRRGPFVFGVDNAADRETANRDQSALLGVINGIQEAHTTS